MEILKKEKQSVISLAVFAIALVVISINLVSLFFPSLIVVLVSGSEIQENPFEVGPWLAPFLAINLFLLVFGILYYTKKLPQIIPNSIQYILNFEISTNVTAIVFTVILFGYVALTMNELSIPEELIFGDYDRVKEVVEKWPVEESIDKDLMDRHITNFFLKASLVLFQNMNVIPFIASIAFLALTYFITVKITKKRFAGIVAMLILFQSFTFYSFDTLVSYPNFWALFYLLSLYLMYSRWQLSPVSYIASIFSKALTAPFLPMLLFFTYRAEIPRRKKVYIVISYAVVAVVAVAIVLVANINLGGGINKTGLVFDWVDFWLGFTAWSAQLRFDGLFLLLVLPVTVGLYIISRKGMAVADAIIVQIVGIILVMPLMSAMTSFDLHPYRYVPLVGFFAIGVGTLLKKN